MGCEVAVMSSEAVPSTGTRSRFSRRGKLMFGEKGKRKRYHFDQGRRVSKRLSKASK